MWRAHSRIQRCYFTGFVPFFRNNFPWLFQDPDRFFQDSQIHNNWSNYPLQNKKSKIILQKIVLKGNFITRVYRFPGLSRTCINLPGLSSPGKCQNKIPGLSRISRTRTNPVLRRLEDEKYLAYSKVSCLETSFLQDAVCIFVPEIGLTKFRGFRETHAWHLTSTKTDKYSPRLSGN